VPHITLAVVWCVGERKAGVRFAVVAALLVGVSLQAAKELHHSSVLASSEWLVPRYAKENGNGSCLAIINKHLRYVLMRVLV
jgi:hypothetical protein